MILSDYEEDIMPFLKNGRCLIVFFKHPFFGGKNHITVTKPEEILFRFGEVVFRFKHYGFIDDVGFTIPNKVIDDVELTIPNKEVIGFSIFRLRGSCVVDSKLKQKWSE